MKKVVEGSVADIQGRIRPNDQVIDVDGVPLSGYCNQVSKRNNSYLYSTDISSIFHY